MTPTSTTDATAASENGARGTSVIVNVLQVIRCFTADEPLQGVTEIAAQVGLHKSSVSRILATLEQEQVVERDEVSRKYRLGLGLIAVAGPLLANLDVRRIAMEDLQALCELTEETVALAIWDGSAAVTVEQVPSPQKIKHTSALGSRYSTGLSASVQAILAAQDADIVRGLVVGGQISLDESTGVEAYLDRRATVRREGHATNIGLTASDEVGIAAPVVDHRGSVVGAVLLAAPAYRITDADVPRLVSACRTAARRISTRLGAAAEMPS
jgi:DNA-binding IclR family transcriptional regulator